HLRLHALPTRRSSDLISETGSTWTVHVLMLVAYTSPGGYIDHDTVSVDTVQVPADAEDHLYEVVWDLRAWEGADPGRRVQHVVRSEEHTSELQSRENL